ncbi:hypothetical protein B1400_1160 [Bifidobacterium italicum]|uniref:Uncharacterized protein n=1 Tax=Bifidobacterium italicum TaxID=1960968 RepID=A0A2A2EJR9_9BIFI|nr:hypothetical protein [Bifidobacterium italicum]PAU69158.1 hypothetical protein B1400_1160 [Bifidobacterium italicum]
MAADDDNKDGNGGFDPDDVHFDDADLEAALEGFEQEFAGTDGADSQPPADGGDAAAGSGDVLGADFEDELQGILGNKAKCAVLCSHLASAELFAAICRLADVDALCVGDRYGAVAILRDLEGNAPETAAHDLTTVISGMDALLVVNRADKIEASIYADGAAVEQIPPPFAFPTLAPFVEDYMIGLVDVAGIEAQADETVDTASIATTQDAERRIRAFMRAHPMPPDDEARR